MKAFLIDFFPIRSFDKRFCRTAHLGMILVSILNLRLTAFLEISTGVHFRLFIKKSNDELIFFVEEANMLGSFLNTEITSSSDHPNLLKIANFSSHKGFFIPESTCRQRMNFKLK
ncbi:hypothetical protein FRX31_034675 [Thalictrum thalictroides]|uniref:Uncharacterized protein n=1 Tax=Thalictrum thalictroides TaxID=46969 RepID=A0A7J6UTH0_THATH|nr:hypothetical protein FRX31_034675 [Thalictrum thalictroides]